MLKPESALWVQTFAGRAVDLWNPEPEQICARDIAVALSRLARFNGHTCDFYSVASHSLLAESLCPPGTWPADRLAVLLHDAHEAYTGDIVAPMKWALQRLDSNAADCEGDAAPPYDAVRLLEADLQRAIHCAVGLQPSNRGAPLNVIPSGLIRDCDQKALAIEKRDLLGPAPRDWGPLPDVTGLPTVHTAPPIYAAMGFGGRLLKLVTDAGLRPLPTFDVGAV